MHLGTRQDITGTFNRFQVSYSERCFYLGYNDRLTRSTYPLLVLNVYSDLPTKVFNFFFGMLFTASMFARELAHRRSSPLFSQQGRRERSVE